MLRLVGAAGYAPGQTIRGTAGAATDTNYVSFKTQADLLVRDDWNDDAGILVCDLATEAVKRVCVSGEADTGGVLKSLEK